MHGASKSRHGGRPDQIKDMAPTEATRHEVALRFNAIYVVESLGYGESKTGESLYDNVIQQLKATRSTLHTAFRRVRSATEWHECVAEIEQECRDNGYAPILHIEAHGDPDGLELASKEHLSWAAMRDALTRLNRISGFNLLAVLGACNSTYLVKVLTPTDPAPVWGMIGQAGTPTGAELLAGFTAFYAELLHSLNGQRALSALNAAVSGGTAAYLFIDARTAFKWVYEQYLVLACDAAALERRENQIMLNIQVTQGIQVANPGAMAWMAETRAEVRRKLREDQLAFFERYRRQFFMFDMFPENAARFPLTFEECLPPGWKGVFDQDICRPMVTN